jgi:hypothetical protein
MARITIKGYLTATRYRWMERDEPLRFNFQSWEPRKDDTETFVVREHAFEVDVPADFNANAAEIAALEAKKDALAAEFAKQVREIQEQLAKRRALEYTPVAEAA